MFFLIIVWNFVFVFDMFYMIIESFGVVGMVVVYKLKLFVLILLFWEFFVLYCKVNK